MSTPQTCIFLLAILVFVLGFAVSSARAKTKTNFGYNTNDPENELYQLVRAHGNTAEYTPILILLIYILSQSQQPAWVIWAMITATFCRYLFIAGLLLPKTMAKPNPMRFIGALGTYLSGMALCIALIL